MSLDLRFVLIFRHPGMVPRNFDAGPTFIPGMPALRPNQPGGQPPKLRVASSNLVARSSKIKHLSCFLQIVTLAELSLCRHREENRRRKDERRRAIMAWGAHVMQIVSADKLPSNVVPLRVA